MNGVSLPLQMTGRKGRVVRQADGAVRYESRAELGHTIDHINVKEKDRFMNEEKVRHPPPVSFTVCEEDDDDVYEFPFLFLSYVLAIYILSVLKCTDYKSIWIKA